MAREFIPKHGGYENLLSFKKAQIIYDGTVKFCERFLRRRDRTVDQMVQAARSGKQNIIEGSRASAISKKTEIRLTNVARASLDELLADYLDFLRVRGFRVWQKESPEALAVRRLAYRPDESFETYRGFIERKPAETVANVMLCLIHQANYLLDKQIRQLETAFVREGGLSERMTAARLRARGNRTK